LKGLEIVFGKNVFHVFLNGILAATESTSLKKPHESGPPFGGLRFGHFYRDIRDMVIGP
jgi:hypothetical protein